MPEKFSSTSKEVWHPFIFLQNSTQKVTCHPPHKTEIVIFTWHIINLVLLMQSLIKGMHQTQRWFFEINMLQHSSLVNIWPWTKETFSNHFQGRIITGFYGNGCHIGFYRVFLHSTFIHFPKSHFLWNFLYGKSNIIL